MNKIQLFFLLRKNTKLSEKRHPMFEANQYGKLIGYIVISILAIEFLALGTFFGWLAAKEDVPEMIFYRLGQSPLDGHLPALRLCRMVWRTVRLGSYWNAFPAPSDDCCQ